MASIVEREFLNHRTLFLIGLCDGDSQQKICAAIHGLNLLSSESITLHIDSNGGGIPPAVHLLDVISLSKAPVHGIVTGRAVSAAFVALQACHRRIAYQSANFMYHAPALASLRVDSSDLETELGKLRQMHERVLRILAVRGRASYDEFAKLSALEKYFDAEEALKLGVIDEIFKPSLN